MNYQFYHCFKSNLFVIRQIKHSMKSDHLDCGLVAGVQWAVLLFRNLLICLTTCCLCQSTKQPNSNIDENEGSNLASSSAERSSKEMESSASLVSTVPLVTYSDWNNHVPDEAHASNVQLVRRHSISIINRTPPEKSIASEILNTPLVSVRKNLMSSIKDLQEVLSDFNSCDFNSCNSTVGSEHSSSSEEHDSLQKLQVSGEKLPRKKGRKRAKKCMTGRFFVKKQDTRLSPQL